MGVTQPRITVTLVMGPAQKPVDWVNRPFEVELKYPQHWSCSGGELSGKISSEGSGRTESCRSAIVWMFWASQICL